MPKLFALTKPNKNKTLKMKNTIRFQKLNGGVVFFLDDYRTHSEVAKEHFSNIQKIKTNEMQMQEGFSKIYEFK